MPIRSAWCWATTWRRAPSELRERGITEMYSGAPFPQTPGQHQRLSRRAADRSRAGRRRRRRDHRALRRFGGDARRAGARVRLDSRSTTTGWRRARWPATWSNAARSATAASSPTGRACPAGTTSAFPIVECPADGSFVVTKPEGTGGLVTPATVAEQMLYEIGDPRAYHVPDVVCDFTDVRFEQDGRRSRARRPARADGRRPTPTRSAPPFTDGFRNMAFLTIAGEQRRGEGAPHRRGAARAHARACWASRAAALQRNADRDRRRRGHVRRARACPTRARSVLKMAASRRRRPALELFAREFAAPAPRWHRATTGLVGGRPDGIAGDPAVLVPVPKREVAVRSQVGDAALPVVVPADGGFDGATIGAARAHAGHAGGRPLARAARCAWRTAAPATRATRPTSASSRAGPSTCRC